MSTKKHIVIGCGVCGLTTALHLFRAHSSTSANMTLLSHHQPQEPSDDISKIVRIDYPNLRRMKEAVYAKGVWETDQCFRQFYQPVGRVVAYGEEDVETLHRIDGARLQLGMQKRERLDHQTFAKIFGPANLHPGLTLVRNDDDSLVEWKGCMRAMQDLVERHCEEDDGSKMLDLQALKLLHEGGRVSAVVLPNEEQIQATDAEVIVAVGPWITELLEKSGIAQPPTSRSPVATGLFAFTLQLNEEQILFFKGKPGFSHNGYAEFLPPTKSDGIAKITCISPFTNRESSSSLSYPRDLSGSSLAIDTMLKMKRWAQKFLPGLGGAKIIKIRSYWDGMTQSQTPLIARHPQYRNLSIVGGGSYNRAKDLPVLGEEVVKMLANEPLHPSYGWHPSDDLSNQDQPRLLARGDFEDLEREAEKCPEVRAWRLKRASQIEHDYLEEI